MSKLKEINRATSDDFLSGGNRVSTRVSQVSLAEPDNLTGWLWKRGNFISSWKKRFFKLDVRNAVLGYYSDDKAKKPNGTISLRSAVVVDDEKNNAGPLEFKVIVEKRPFIIKAEKKADKMAWVAGAPNLPSSCP